MLYFILALLDKWVSLIDGGSLTGLTSSDKNLRMPVGFGLAYYLVGAVLLDFNAQRLFELASKSKDVVVPTDGDIQSAAMAKSHNRKVLYWITLGRYLLWHVWGLAATATLVWVFASEDAATPTIIFMSYVLAYTGLLWYQVHTRIPKYSFSYTGTVHESFLWATRSEALVNWSMHRVASGVHSPPRVSSLHLHGYHCPRGCDLDCCNPIALGWKYYRDSRREAPFIYKW